MAGGSGGAYRDRVAGIGGRVQSGCVGAPYRAPGADRQLTASGRGSFAFGRRRPGGRPILLPTCPQHGREACPPGGGGGAVKWTGPEAPVSHTAVVKDVLLCLAIVLTLVLAAFIGAVIR